jgi:XisH protein
MVKDMYHDHVREALEKDGWFISDDPYYVPIGNRRGFIDLGAEKSMIVAERESETHTEFIAVEVKSFIGKSDLTDFENALGKFQVYLYALEDIDPERVLFLAIPLSFYNRFFIDAFFVKLIKRANLKILVFDEKNRTVHSWIK